MSTPISQVTSQDLAAQLQNTTVAPLLLDVRTPLEHREVHLAQARLLPLDELDPVAFSKEVGRDQDVVVICRGGGRASKAAEKLISAGMTHVHVLQGGMQAWSAAGLPANQGKSAVSLERQVRIAAGLLVLTGVALGTWIHPGFYGLSAFVGAGLVFAGITDWCGMGLLLAKAPWNTISSSARSTGTCCTKDVA